MREDRVNVTAAVTLKGFLHRGPDRAPQRLHHQPAQPPHSPTSVRPTASSSSTTSPSPTTTSAATGSMVVVISSSKAPQQQQQLPQQQHQQVTQQPLQTPRRTRESAESVGRLLASTIGEDWNLMDSGMGRLSQTSLGTLNTPNLSTISPGQARPHVASGDQASQVSQADETSSNATE